MRRGLLCCVAVAMLAACGHKDEAPRLAKNELAALDGQTLTVTQLREAVPAGLSEEDSTRLAQAFIRNWIETRLVERVASERVDMDEIDALTAQYRRDLIAQRYRDMLFARTPGAQEFGDSVVADYYERHSADFVLERPMIRGVYVKLPDGAPELPAIRRIYRSTRPQDIDRLEKEVLGSAIHYDYFRDHWIEWEQVEARIPYDFGPKPADYVRSHHNLDVSLGGFTYLLEISDLLPAGSPMPLEIARPLIEDRLLAERRQSYDAAMRRRLYDDALNSGRLKVRE